MVAWSHTVGGVVMKLTRDEKLWLLTAHPDTLDLAEEAPGWLIGNCHVKGLVKPGPATGVWRLTEAGYAERRALLD